MNRRTGPLSWLLAHIRHAFRELAADPVSVLTYWRPAKPLPQRQRKTTPGWRTSLPGTFSHPDFWCSLSPSQEQEWAEISKHLDMPPAVPQPRREQP